MTGDVTINPTASCLVMTTEVCCYFIIQFAVSPSRRFCVQCFIVAPRSCERLHGLYLTKSTTCEIKVDYI